MPRMKLFANKPDAAKPAPAKGGKSGAGTATPRRSSKAAPPPPPPPKPLLTPDQWLDILGWGMVIVSAITLLGALSFSNSPLIGGWLKALETLFGLGFYLAPVIMGFVGFYLVLRRFGDRFPRLRVSIVSGVVLAFVCVLGTLHAVWTISSPAVGEHSWGGQIGSGLIGGLADALGNVGAALILLILWLVAFMLMSNVTMAEVITWVDRQIQAIRSGRPNDDVIVPGYDGDPGFVINGIKPKGAKAARSRNPEPDLAIDLSGADTEPAPTRPARALNPASNAPALSQGREPKLNVPVAPDRPLTINAPGNKRTIASPPKTPLANKLPPARVIGGANEHKEEAGMGNGMEAQPAMTSAQPATQISSRIAIERDWALPKIDEILDPGNDSTMQEKDIRERARVIEETLDSFGVPGRIVEVNRGPTITQYGVEPGFIAMKSGKQVKVKVSRIAGLADDLALALAAPRIRIEAPIPGRGLVGIEVPNGETAIVSLRDVMESQEFANLQRKTKLRLGLGQDVSGKPVVADMTTMPHLLIAGTTGSGKSVCVNAIICALMCYNSPADLRFIMVDPKRVELTGYNGIPHLIAPVVVDVEKVTGVLSWVVREMDQRYRTFAKYGARNIVDFNTKAEDGGRKTEDGKPSPVSRSSSSDPDLKKLPYIVVVIDELADLMMLAPDETEKTLVRLAQMARATGIHLIIATQRPSVDVVTGLIKANFPARIAFTVATSVDSRVILDSPGAEKLLGRGDMLVVMPEQPLPMRSQGCWLSNPEIERVVRHWRAQLGGNGDAAAREIHTVVSDPITASMSAPSVPIAGTLTGEQVAMPTGEDPFNQPPTWDEARAMANAAGEVGVGKESGNDKLFNDAVATVRMNGKASISLLQRRLRIGYTRAARLIEEMESKGIVGPQMQGSQFREVLNSPLGDGEI